MQDRAHYVLLWDQGVFSACAFYPARLFILFMVIVLCHKVSSPKSPQLRGCMRLQSDMWEYRLCWGTSLRRPLMSSSILPTNHSASSQVILVQETCLGKIIYLITRDVNNSNFSLSNNWWVLWMNNRLFDVCRHSQRQPWIIGKKSLNNLNSKKQLPAK